MVEAQEVEPFGTSLEVHDPGLVGMQPQPEWGQDRRHAPLGLVGARTVGAQDHEIIGVSNEHPQLPTAVRPGLVEDVEGDVGQQRGQDAALRSTGHGRLALAGLGEDTGPTERLDQPQHALVFDSAAHPVQQGRVVDGVKARLDIRVQHPVGCQKSNLVADQR